MKRFLAAVSFCFLLLAGLSCFLFPVADAAENPILVLLNLPSPPPPNPQVSLRINPNPGQGYDKKNPPPDDAPIEVLIEFWRTLEQTSNDIGYKVYPSEKVLDRLMAEMQRNPEIAPDLLNAFPRNSRSADFVKGLYDRMTGPEESQLERRAALKRWLKYNTAYYSADLAREAARVKDSNGYVTHHHDLIALARVDWDRANPIVSRLYTNPGQKASQIAAIWALYLHAMDVGSPSDTERYRDELKATVEDKSLSDGIRDLALDALSLEKEWSGRDEWYLSLMQDETLLELGTYTGLTTLISASPDEKYIERMISLLDSDNINVRTAAARNLLTKLSKDRPEIVKALLPWLGDPKWLRPNTNGRDLIIQALARVKVPESVPFLIAALDEKQARIPPVRSTNANFMVWNAANAAALAANRAANAAQRAADAIAAAAQKNSSVGANSSLIDYGSDDEFPLRYNAIVALGNQEDSRAVPALRRVFNEMEPAYQLSAVVTAIYACGGFTITEQVNALEDVAKNTDEMPAFTSANANAANVIGKGYPSLPTFSAYDRNGRIMSDMTRLLGIFLTQLTVVKDDLGLAVVDRIESLDRTDAKTADSLRRIVMQWESPAVYGLQLRDLKNDRVDADSLLRLLAVRHTLREKLNSEVFAVRTGGQTAFGISACLLEDPNEYEGILDKSSDEAKLAFLACARLIRAPLPVGKVAANLQSKDKLLALAAERYLVSEDSAEARRIALSLHPNEAKITGATTAFFFAPFDATPQSLSLLFATVSQFHALSPASLYNGAYSDSVIAQSEAGIKEELKKDPELLGVYNWQENYIHIYKDRVQLSWRDDPARYRERTLSKEEFDAFKALIAHYKADDLPPFLECQYCEPREFLMLGRNGGRRIYVKSSTLPPFFAELDQKFAELRRQPASVKYWATKGVPGLEVLFADDRLDAKAVWKNAGDFRLLTSDKVKRAEIDQEIQTFAESAVEEAAEDDENQSSDTEIPLMDETLTPNPLETEQLRRQYENFAWFDFSSRTLGALTAQPNDVPFIPLKDDLSVPPLDTPWKATAGTTEIRSDEKGLYKVAAGKLTKIQSGYYGGVVVTSDGKWAVATKHDGEDGQSLVRVNLLTNREYSIDPEDFQTYRPIAFVPTINRILLGSFETYGIYRGRRSESGKTDAGPFWLLDPVTGKLTMTDADMRALAQQTIRPLQRTSTPFEYWAAIPDEKETVVGLYNARTFYFKPVLTLPEIRFNSMDMWVDTSESKLYFVYEGHLLAAPLKQGR